MQPLQRMKTNIPTASNVRGFAQVTKPPASRGYSVAKAAGEATRTARNGLVKAATPEVVQAGTGDVDNRRMLTGPLQNMQAVVRSSGAASVGSVAYSVTKDTGKEYPTRFFDGLMAPFGKYPATPETTPNPNVNVRSFKPVAVQRSRAGNLSALVMQKANVW